MLSMLKKYAHGIHADESGKMTVEMILLITLIALPIVLLLVLFRDKIIGWFKGQQSQLQDPGTPSLN